jgi:conjugal transfer mating pair stabilization protein TraN
MAFMPTEKTTADTRAYVNDGTVDPDTGICEGTAFIFNGKGRECRTAGTSTTFFNCCNTDPGSFMFIQNTCGSEELMTVKGLAAGNCHYVGDYCKEKWPLIGCVQRANMYCCFGSKLSRIIHEQGRAQLKAFNGWGGAENPDCRGFTPEEFQMIDFAKIDLSEYFSDIEIKSQSAIQQNMQQKISDIYEQIK